jgi:hypothetical protein
MIAWLLFGAYCWTGWEIGRYLALRAQGVINHAVGLPSSYGDSLTRIVSFLFWTLVLRKVCTEVASGAKMENPEDTILNWGSKLDVMYCEWKWKKKNAGRV